MSQDCFVGWQLWDFTSVVYVQGDKISFGLAIMSVMPQLFVVAFLSSLLTNPRKSLLALLWGMLLNEILSVVLKNVIQQPRPVHPSPLAQRDDFGMPSRHAQFMFFLVSFCYFDWSAAAAARYSKLSVKNRRCLKIMLASALAVSVSRVYNEYHTFSQVLVGAIVGIVIAFLFVTIRICSVLVRISLPMIEQIRSFFL